MNVTRQIAVYTIAAISLLISACTNVGNDPRFARPATLGDKVVVTADQIGGHEFQITDEDGPYWIRTATDNKLTSGIGGHTYVKDGSWSVQNGNLCLKSSVWWKGGDCFELYGGDSVATAKTIHILNSRKGPNTFFPFRQMR